MTCQAEKKKKLKGKPTGHGDAADMKRNKATTPPNTRKALGVEAPETPEVGVKTELGENLCVFLQLQTLCTEDQRVTVEDELKDTRPSKDWAGFYKVKACMLNGDPLVLVPLPCLAPRLQLPNFHLPGRKLEESSREKLAKGWHHTDTHWWMSPN